MQMGVFRFFSYAGYKTVAVSGAPDHVPRAGQPQAYKPPSSIREEEERKRRRRRSVVVVEEEEEEKEDVVE